MESTDKTNKNCFTINMLETLVFNVFSINTYCIYSIQLTKDKQNASQHPNLYSSETFSLGRVSGDIVEDVDQHQEEGHQESHAPYYLLCCFYIQKCPTWYNVRGNKKGNPAHGDKQTRWEIVSDDVGEEVTLQSLKVNCQSKGLNKIDSF